MNTVINGILITGAQGVVGSQGVQGPVGVQGIAGIQGVSNILRNPSGRNISSAYLSFPTSQIVLSANRIYAIPFLPAYNSSYSSLSIFVAIGQPSALCKILIYNDLNSSPNNLIYESANIDCSTSGRKIVNVSGTFLAGVTYWFCVWNGTPTPTLNAIAPQSLSSIRLTTTTPISHFIRTVTFGTTTPNPFGAVTPATLSAPLIVTTLN